MVLDRERMNYILPIGANLNSVSMGSFATEGKNSNTFLGTFGLEPCTALVSSVRDSENNVYRFCAHIDLGEIWGLSIEAHINQFKLFLNKIKDIKGIKIELVSSQSFLNPQYLSDNEQKLLLKLNSLKNKYEFSITHKKSTVVQIAPNGEIQYPSKSQIEQNKFKAMRDVAIANGYTLDYSTKTPCIIDKKLGCYLFDISSSLEAQLQNKFDGEKEIIIKNDINSGLSWKSLIKLGGEVEIGISPLNPNKLAFFKKLSRSC